MEKIMEMKDLKYAIYDDLYSSIIIDRPARKNSQAKRKSIDKILSSFPEEYSKAQKLNFLQEMYECYFSTTEKEKCENIRKTIEEMQNVQ
jgi:exonuclease I